MTTEQINITLGVSLILGDVINEILYAKKTDENGQTYTVDRDLPFKLRYKLNKNRMIFEKDSKEFQNYRLIALAQYGEPSEDGKSVVINDPEKQELFKKRISELIEVPVSHNIVRLDPDDFDAVTDTTITISPDAMSLFIGYMTNDPELLKDLESKLNVEVGTLAETTEETPAEKEETKVEEAPKKTRKPRTKKTTEEATNV